MAYLELTLQVDPANRAAAAGVYEKYKQPFLETVPGATRKELLIRDEDVHVLHGFRTAADAEAYLASVAVDGSDIREITQPPESAIAADGSPSVSPDGKTIAFSRAIPGEPPHIYLVGIDGSGLRRLTQGNSAEIQPVWSPDGTHIAFSRADGEHFDLFVAGGGRGPGLAPRRLRFWVRVGGAKVGERSGEDEREGSHGESGNQGKAHQPHTLGPTPARWVRFLASVLHL